MNLLLTDENQLGVQTGRQLEGLVLHVCDYCARLGGSHCKTDIDVPECIQKGAAIVVKN